MSIFTKHFVMRLKERFPEVVEELGIPFIHETIRDLIKNNQLELFKSNDDLMFHIDLKIFNENSNKYKKYKMSIVASKDLTAMITVLTGKMFCERIKKNRKERKKVRYYNNEKYYA